jgi:hypothetical protein
MKKESAGEALDCNSVILGSLNFEQKKRASPFGPALVIQRSDSLKSDRLAVYVSDTGFQEFLPVKPGIV